MEGKDGRTERATPKRREDERRKGNLCISPEVTSLAVLIVGILALRHAVPTMFGQLRVLLIHVARFDQLGSWTAETVRHMFAEGFVALTALMAPVVVPVLLAGVVGSMVQTRPYFSMEALKINFGALNPVKGIGNLVSLQAGVQMVTGLAKVAVIAGIGYLLMRNEMQVLVGLQNTNCAPSIEWILRLIYRVTLTVTVVFGAIALLDWCFRKWQYERNMMMTKQEVTDEHRQHEPNPVVRKAIARKMRQLSLARMMAAVPNANVVITNPDHVAVAIEYDAATMGAPRVTAKGLRLMAERIKQVAREHNVPIVRRPETARALYKHVEVGHPIPARLFEAVAEILAYLHRLGRDIGLSATSRREPATGGKKTAGPPPIPAAAAAEGDWYG